MTMCRRRTEFRFYSESSWISWVAAPAGDVTYATGRDITAEREQALALAQTEEQLRQAQAAPSVLRRPAYQPLGARVLN